MAISLFVFLVLNACTKQVEQQIQDDVTGKKNSTSNARSGAGGEAENIEDILLSESPTRDIVKFVKNGGRLPDTKYLKDFRHLMSGEKTGGLLGTTFPYVCGSMLILGYPGAPNPCNPPTSESRMSNITQTANSGNSILPNSGCPFYVNDAWNNKIHAFGIYGNEDRQAYYIYLPDNFNANSKIVVLVHGGGWISGPDPDQVNGWGSPYSTAPAQNNIVKDLITQGYVVVSVLYRLVNYGVENLINNTNEFSVNPIGILDQVSDINAAITHVHANFPSCLDINAENIQVLGESAGGNLALLYAYTKVNANYIKSVVSVAGPTNMNQFADTLRRKPLPLYQCGGNYTLASPNPNTPPIYTNTPYYLSMYDTPTDVVATVSNMNCTVAAINGDYNSPFLHPAKRIADTYFIAQSCVRQKVTSFPSAAFNNVSPCVKLNSSNIVPTFIAHGTDDWIVPYGEATATMDTKLTNTGGLNFYTSAGSNTFPSIAQIISSPNKHLIKWYWLANHIVSVHAQTRGNVLTWFNAH